MSISFICLCCGKEKTAAAKSAGQQSYCGERPCQQARKTAWQRKSLATDPDHRSNQRQSQQDWCRAHPDYWAEYRRRNPAKAERNRLLQTRRDRLRRPSKASAPVLAKMDALISVKSQKQLENVEFWLVPVLAKMDALRVKIIAISDD